jgi:hypothetical protein
VPKRCILNGISMRELKFISTLFCDILFFQEGNCLYTRVIYQITTVDPSMAGAAECASYSLKETMACQDDAPELRP